MIIEKNNIFLIETKDTTYLFRVMETGHLEHLYYGKKLEGLTNISSEQMSEVAIALATKTAFALGNSTVYSEEFSNVSFEYICQEISTHGKGDYREHFVEVEFENGSISNDFVFDSFAIKREKDNLNKLPSSYRNDKQVWQLEIVLKEKHEDVYLTIIYCVFEDSDVITRSSRLYNKGTKSIKVNRLMSNQLDFFDGQYVMSHFGGQWIHEMNRYDTKVSHGKHINSSSTGFSSNKNNPFTMLSKENTTEDFGDCYGFNLIYSGNHYCCVQKDSYDKTRVVQGINYEGLSFLLSEGEEFQSPESIMVFSSLGFTKMSHELHHFIRHHIVRGHYQYKERPILINSWETMYFDFNEGKLLKLASIAKQAGIELFVLDDGWFGKRDDDRTSLGDWYVNEKKLPGGLKQLSKKINGLGMDFGIWVEPEMISEESECYRKHPEWAVKIEGRDHSIGRNQMILDFTREDVRAYVKQEMTKVFSSGNIAYVKWDMNRNFSDMYSPTCKKGMFAYNYMVGLYEVLEELTNKFPNILFEACASGGNRFDLGMLCYMPQIWASDNTDSMCRANIQEGYSYGYPQSVIAGHVPGCPNHQTLRNTSLSTSFNISAFSLLGYECNLLELSKEEFDKVKEQISFYKEHRKTFQFGTLYRLNEENQRGMMVVSKDRNEGLGMCYQEMTVPNSPFMRFQTKGLTDNIFYKVTNQKEKINIMEFGDLVNTISPVHIKKDSLVHHAISKVVKLDGEEENYTLLGSVLNHSGIALKQGYSGVGFSGEVRLNQDFSSRMYLFSALLNMEE